MVAKVLAHPQHGWVLARGREPALPVPVVLCVSPYG